MQKTLAGSLTAAVLTLLSGCSNTNAPQDTDPVRYTSVSAGFGHTCGLSTEGRMYCWGKASFTADSVPHEVALPEPVVGISAANSVFGGSTCGWTAAGRVYCWGRWIPLTDITATYGNGVEPVEISGAGPLSGIANSTGHGCGLRSDSTVACWGGFVFGKRGLVQPDDSTWSTLTAAPIASGMKFKKLATGFRSTCGIMLDGQVACWGDSGVVGNAPGTYLDTRNPCFYQSLACLVDPGIVPGVSGVTAISNVGDRTCVVGSLGVQCWGYEIPGVETVALPFSPVDVGVAWDFACALSPDGVVYCWGALNFEDETDGDTISPPVPYSVAGHQFIQLSVGRHHVCGIIDDGSMYCWGDMTAALGTGDGARASLPVRVAEPRS